MKRKINLIIIFFILLAGLLAACSSATETPEPVTPSPTALPEEVTNPPTDTPATDTPATDTPATDTPATDTPATDTPATDTPATDTPATDTPATDTPATDTPPPAAEAQPAAPDITGRIVFPVYDETAGTYNLYIANANGSNRQKVAASASQPDLNAEGTRIVFRSWQGDKRGLIEQGLDGSSGWLFNIHFEAGRPKFAPDGMSFLFHSKEAGDQYAIYRTQNEGYDVLRREANPIQGEAPTWTPNGQSFIYKGCTATDCGLFFSNLDGSSMRQLTNNLSDTNAQVAPNGQTIVYMSEVDGNWDIWTVNLDGSNKRQLTTDPGRDGLPAWSPDGRSIAFVSNRGGPSAIWAMSADGSNQRQLFELGGPIDGQVQIDQANSWGWLEESIAWVP